MKSREVSEGKTKLIVPVTEKLTKKNLVFFNPQMELSRDISVAVAKILKPERFCDLLAGSGARGIRIANETGCEATVNDIKPEAFRLIERNKELNKAGVNATNLDANQLLSKEKFDFIDIDPFGSPVRFIDSAARSIRNNGFLAVTATDTSALCGTYPRACRRKYDALSLRTDYYNELGLRILLGYVARVLLKYDFCVEPLFSHCTRHYFRVYVKVKRSAKKANEQLHSIAYIQHCFKCLYRGFSVLDDLREECDCGSALRTSGPLWVSCFADPGFCQRLERQLIREDFRTLNESLRLVSGVGVEQQVHVPYYDMHKLSKRLGSVAPSMSALLSGLLEHGFMATRTHFSGVGVRTDAAVSEIYRVMSGLI